MTVTLSQDDVETVLVFEGTVSSSVNVTTSGHCRVVLSCWPGSPRSEPGPRRLNESPSLE